MRSSFSNKNNIEKSTNNHDVICCCKLQIELWCARTPIETQNECQIQRSCDKDFRRTFNRTDTSNCQLEIRRKSSRSFWPGTANTKSSRYLQDLKSPMSPKIPSAADKYRTHFDIIGSGSLNTREEVEIT